MTTLDHKIIDIKTSGFVPAIFPMLKKTILFMSIIVLTGVLLLLPIHKIKVLGLNSIIPVPITIMTSIFSIGFSASTLITNFEQMNFGGILSAAYFPIGSYLNYCFHLPGVLFVTYFVPATTLLFAGIFVIFLLFDKNINLERTDEKF